jgi:hypothetical protein
MKRSCDIETCQRTLTINFSPISRKTGAFTAVEPGGAVRPWDGALIRSKNSCPRSPDAGGCNCQHGLQTSFHVERTATPPTSSLCLDGVDESRSSFIIAEIDENLIQDHVIAGRKTVGKSPFQVSCALTAGEEVVQMHARMKPEECSAHERCRPRQPSPGESLGSCNGRIDTRHYQRHPYRFKMGDGAASIHLGTGGPAPTSQRSCKISAPAPLAENPNDLGDEIYKSGCLPMAWVKIGVIDRYVYASQRRTCGCYLTYFTQLFPVQPAGLGIVHCR